MRKRLILKSGASLIAGVFLLFILCAVFGCSSYEGGKVIDGTNLEVGISIPGTEWNWTINALSYTGGIKVCGDEKTTITVTNSVAETNSYFGVIKTQRYTQMSTKISPKYYVESSTNGVPAKVYLLDTDK